MAKRSIEEKKVKRVGRAARRKRSIAKLPPLMLVVSGTTIRRHRYLASHSLPHSASVAAAPTAPPQSRKERATGRQSYKTNWRD